MDEQSVMTEGFMIPLRNGDEARVRPIRPEDKSVIMAAFKELSRESIHNRFFVPLLELPARMLVTLTEVDQVNHVAWGIHQPHLPGKPGIAVGRYVRLKDEPAVAEVALTVIDQFQGKGLGTFLLALLYRLAQHHGDIHTLRGVIHHGNSKTLAWMRALGAEFRFSEEYLMQANLSVVQGIPQMPVNRAARRFNRVLSLIQDEKQACPYRR